MHFLGLWVLFFTGCGSSVPSPPDLGPRSNLSAEQAASARAACTFKAGTVPGLSLAKGVPIGPEIPIDTIVIVMMENRSFDHLLGNLPAAGQPDVAVAALDATNPDGKGQPVARFHLKDYCFDDTNHSWSGSRTEWHGGKNDGFVLANDLAHRKNAIHDPEGHRAMGFYDQNDLPFLYALASSFSIGDHYFCSLLGPTVPNREFLYAATSFGVTFNHLVTQPQPTLLEALSGAAVPWHVYAETLPGSAIFASNFVSNHGDHYDTFPAFLEAAVAGTLESVVLVDPNLRDGTGADRDDYHPPGDVQVGDAFLAKVVGALTASPQWAHLALFITFDEHGGLYDHVPPPTACPPDDSPIALDHGNPMPAPGEGFDRLGFRVPLIVVSPYARPHFVSHRVYDHTSIARFVEARFLLGALSARDANADPLYELFDFSRPQLLTPPQLPAVPVDAAKLAACLAQFPGQGNDGGLDVETDDAG